LNAISHQEQRLFQNSFPSGRISARVRKKDSHGGLKELLADGLVAYRKLYSNGYQN
jgi:hypothetical protein